MSKKTKITSAVMAKKKSVTKDLSQKPEFVVSPLSTLAATKSRQRIFAQTDWTSVRAFGWIFVLILMVTTVITFASPIAGVISAPTDFFKASVLSSELADGVTGHAVAVATETDMFENMLFIALASTAVSIFLFSTLLKIKAKQEMHDSTSENYKFINHLPSVSIVEVLTFAWVISCLVLSTYYLLSTFTSGSMTIFDSESGIDESATFILFFLSFVCGLLGGSLSNLKFFLPKTSKVDRNGRFDIRLTYRYLANPFFSSVIGFLGFLLMVNLNVIGLENLGIAEEQAAKVNALSFVFAFVLVGYFSETFIMILHALAKKVRRVFEGMLRIEEHAKV